LDFAFYHDSAAVLLGNGDIVAAASEERFTRRRATRPSRIEPSSSA